VDYCLEKDVVSRFHAKITKEQEQYYITDLNSTNGTFVNQEPLQTYQKKEIKLGDEIAFANIRYQFLQQNIC
jgi:pSer/pThr/pTyr-binding forkhead associated (FHA) protein